MKSNFIKGKIGRFIFLIVVWLGALSQMGCGQEEEFAESAETNLPLLVVVLVLIWLACCVIVFFATRLWYKRRLPHLPDPVVTAKRLKVLRYILYGASFLIVALYFALKVLVPSVTPF
jgi:heme/copper-type cytochrome/quinol oxidase subunit 2